MGLHVKFWGVRGSIPAPLEPQTIENRIKQSLENFFEFGYSKKSDIDDYLSKLPIEKKGGYGGNTACLEYYSDKTSIIVDAGSGIRRKSYELLSGPCGKGKGEVHVLFTHFHWDHILGLPFFIPIFIPGNKIHVYAVQPELEKTIELLFSKPNFPVPYETLKDNFVFHQLKPRKTYSIGDIKFTPYKLDHPDPCWGYRIEHNNRVVAHSVDTECTRRSANELGEDLPMYQNVNTMIFDAQYTLMEAIERVNWGHAAAAIGIDLAMRENIEKIVFMHHDPSASDEKIAHANWQTDEYYSYEKKMGKKSGSKTPKVDYIFAQEDMIIEI